MRLRHWRTAFSPEPPKETKHIRWSRYILGAILALVIVYVGIPLLTTISADGLIQGQLVPVTALYQARVTDTLVQCNQQVQKGQPIAVISNFLLQERYAGQQEQDTNDLAVENVTQQDDLSSARIEEDKALADYSAATVEAAKKRTVFDNYDEAYKAGGIGRATWEVAFSDWQEAQAEEQAFGNELSIARVHTQNVLSEGNAKKKAFAGDVRRLGALASRVQSEQLTAPISGYIVSCESNVERDQVVDAGKPLFHIFGTDQAYALAFFDPGATPDIRLGDKIRIQVTGLAQPIEGRVAAIYPELSKLPDSLTKYFWEREQWNEYRPVQIMFDELDPALRSQLTYNAPLHTSILRRWIPWSH
jgi:multidrug resistance efflux pump